MTGKGFAADTQNKFRLPRVAGTARMRAPDVEAHAPLQMVSQKLSSTLHWHSDCLIVFKGRAWLVERGLRHEREKTENGFLDAARDPQCCRALLSCQSCSGCKQGTCPGDCTSHCRHGGALRQRRYQCSDRVSLYPHTTSRDIAFSTDPYTFAIPAATGANFVATSLICTTWYERNPSQFVLARHLPARS